jgi:HAMP domain-containing protein
MGLRAKFNLVMLVAFLVGLGLAAVLSNRLLQDDAREAVLQEAAVMMGQASAISQYTDNEIGPLLSGQLKVRFLPQTIPFWAAQTNFRTLQQQFPEYSFRELALNPSNPSDRPTDWQADIIELFRRDPKLTEFVSERDTPAGPILSYSRPIKVADQSCLECHSTPSAAPSSMIDLYGPNNGFGWTLGDTVGAQIVSVPMRVPLERSNRAFVTMMIGLTAVFLVMLGLLNILLHYFIILPVRRISAVASEVSLGNMDAPEFVPRGRDEIASLADSFNRMRRSLANALKLLDR